MVSPEEWKKEKNFCFKLKKKKIVLQQVGVIFNWVKNSRLEKNFCKEFSVICVITYVVLQI